ncbi:MAG: hypothetical protein DMG39_09540 [Acidobacteria bacterium]|nr:MAG: hypothetical protein DMG39_09540 [Acidobacteriota bacterium]
MTQIEELQGALEELVNLLFADFVRSKKSVKVEVGESAIRNPRWEKLAQAAGLDGTELANLLEDDSPQGILEDVWVEQAADFVASATFD